MAISERTKKILWGRSGGKCAFPACNKDLFGDYDSVNAYYCHIVAQKAGGPRGNAEYNRELIDSVDNIIILCGEHHKLIDDFPGRFTVESLRSIKRVHEDEVKARMNMGCQWKVNFSQIYYMNIKRLGMLAAQQGMEINAGINENQCLHSLGWDLNALMLKVSRLVNAMLINVVSFEEDWKNLNVGQMIEIKGNYYTKNIPTPDKVMSKKYKPTGGLTKDAHLYQKKKQLKMILTIDPNWLATSTAFVNFKRGRVDVAGVGLVTGLDKEKNELIVTPYILGVPKNEFDDLF